jgi:hypothetical protein
MFKNDLVVIRERIILIFLLLSLERIFLLSLEDCLVVVIRENALR